MRHVVLSFPSLDLGGMFLEDFGSENIPELSPEFESEMEVIGEEPPMPVLGIYDFRDCMLGLPEDYKTLCQDVGSPDDITLSSQVPHFSLNSSFSSETAVDVTSDAAGIDVAEEGVADVLCESCVYHQRRLKNPDVCCGLCYLRKLSEELNTGKI